MQKFWKILNIRNTTKHWHKNDPDSIPFKSIDDERLFFLEQFANWLESWRDSEEFKLGLSPYTYRSTIWTCRSLIQLIKHLLFNLDFRFVMTVKFQTDQLEGMSGTY